MVAVLAGLVPLADVLSVFVHAAAGPLFVEFPFESQYVTSIIYVSLYVSLSAVALSTLFSVPVALVVGFTDFPGERLVKAAINTGMGFPSVVVGLVVLFAVSNQGPLGELELVFTKEAMILSQFVLATPPITGIALAAVTGVQADVRDAAFALGGTRVDVALAVVKEARYGIATAVLAGFGRAISEVGSVLIVGGNIAGSDGVSKTRTLTTAVQLEARQGRYETALVLGAVLLVLVLAVNAVVVRFGDGGQMR
ncbi:ABC transporter permease [Halobacterium noricense]|uniref:ABC transporter permease n=1 Tax=Halobacterium noricense TaxID=223182 RepID=UPI001E55FF28|nr:ABC transporter permease [Halobacterium noricense]UHH24780.1 ABC transporter permease [Halobacterium noricense]